MRTIGIDIGSYSIKVAEVEAATNGSIRLRDFFELELPHDPGGDQRFETVQLLKKIAFQYDLKNTKIAINLGAEHTTTRVVEFPFTERRKILQSLPFELEDNVPFSQDDAIFDFRAVNRGLSSTQVLAVVAPKKYIKEVLSLGDDAGLDPDVISVDGIALSNIQVTNPDSGVSAETPAAGEVFLHIGYKKTILNVTKNGALLMSRAIYFGGADMATSLARAYELPYLEALKGVTEKGFVLTSKEGVDEDQIAFSQVISDSLNILINDVKRTLVDLKTEMHLDYNQVIVSGGMCNLLNLANYLTQELNIPTIIRENSLAQMSSDIVLSPSSQKVGGIAVGLAIESAKKPKNPPINLRRNEFSKQSNSIGAFFEQRKTLFQASLAVFFFFLIFTFFRGDFIQENIVAADKVISDRAKSNNIGLMKNMTGTESLKKFVRSKKAELESQKLVYKLNQMSSGLDVLKTISSAMPSKDKIKLDILYLRVQGEQVIMEGTVSSEAEFGLFQRRITQLADVSGFKLGPAPKADTGKYYFQVNMNFKRNHAKDIR